MKTLRIFGLVVSLFAAGCHDTGAGAGAGAGTGTGTAPPPMAGSRLGAVLGDVAGSAGFALANAPIPFVFPEEHGAHPAFRSEWWYLTMTLQTDEGQELGAQFTVFRQGFRPMPSLTDRANDWSLDQVYLGHLAITDVAAGVHRHEERLSRQHPELAGVQPLVEGGARVHLEGWQLDLQTASVGLHARGADLSLELDLSPSGPPVLQGDRGWSRKSESQASYYYSWPRLQVSGTVTVGARSHAVLGTGWFDHEWSTSVLSAQQVGWEWFTLNLDDGRDLMVFRLRRRDGLRDPHDHGLMVLADGTSRTLDAGAFELAPQRVWTDPEGTEWPLGWKLSLGAEEFLIETPVDDQRMQTLIPYWEGLIHVTSRSGRLLGRGYMELTGYEGRQSGGPSGS